jgi:hypothetical protein
LLTEIYSRALDVSAAADAANAELDRFENGKQKMMIRTGKTNWRELLDIAEELQWIVTRLGYSSQ